jgi:isoprenylcysteine carboxyl methyltransferase (ICMT) family protein YpbQ
VFVFSIAFIFRLGTLIVSIENEKKLNSHDAVGYGATNSIVIGGAHLIFYLMALCEGRSSGGQINVVTLISTVIYVASAAVLVSVIKLLDRLWTVTLLIDRDHVLATLPLFDWIRHPSSFLNIVPELIGLTLTLQAFKTLIIGLPLYLMPLCVRIRQEEATMRRVSPIVRFPSA